MRSPEAMDMGVLNAATTNLAQKGLAALEPARRRALLEGALRDLRERDGYGNELGTLPYSDKAIVELTALHEADPEDLEVIHHLAIARHSRAWDWELAGDRRAVGEWEEGLKYWRMLQTSGEFWAGLKARFAVLADAGSSAAWLDEVRATLLEQLMEVHADFIGAYADTGQRARAMEHVKLVRRARIPPVAQERLLERVFGAMTSGVAKARQRGDFEAALSSTTRFVELFPDYLPGLRLHAEIGAARLDGLSYEGGWGTILAVAEGVRPVAEALVQHDRLDSDPLARSALIDLGLRLVYLADQRGSVFIDAENRGVGAAVDAEAAGAAFTFGLEWGRLVAPLAPDPSPLRHRFAECAKGRAWLANRSAARAFRLASPMRSDFVGAERQLAEARVTITETLRECRGDADSLGTFLEQIDGHLTAVRDALSQWGGSN